MPQGRSDPQPRAWQVMLSGRRLNLLHPSPLDIEIEDIAHGLSRLARWNGQTSGAQAWSVAQHSLLVERLAVRLKDDLDVRWRLAALLHDAPEFVIGDLISPFKAVIGTEYRQVEDRLLAAIHLRFGLPATLPERVAKLIKRADRISAGLEAVQLAGFSRHRARRLFGRSQTGRDIALDPCAPDEARRRFLERFAQLVGSSGSHAGAS